MSTIADDVVDSASIAAASTKRKSLWAIAIRNPGVIIGGTILLIMVAMALAFGPGFRRMIARILGLPLGR